MVNYKRAVCKVGVLSALLAVAFAAPAPDTEQHYDQRQNGTENYRLNIDGVVIAIIPPETIDAGSEKLAAIASAVNEYLVSKVTSKPSSSGSTDSSDSELESEKSTETPTSDVSLHSEMDVQSKHASAEKQERVQRLKNKLASVLIPMLRKEHHH